jgi:hypothetical protein
MAPMQLSSAAGAPVATRAATSADCSKATVLAAAIQAGVADARFPYYVAGGACGAFLGPGSQAMAVNLLGQQCDPNGGWTVLAFVAGAWQHVPGPWDQIHQIIGVSASGDDVREEWPTFRTGDDPCAPTGGSTARIWHWDGAALTAGPFMRAMPADPRPTAFWALGRRLQCSMSDDHRIRQVFCQHRVRPLLGVKLGPSGRFKRCHDFRNCLGDPGENDIPRVLRANRRITVGRFRCRSHQAASLTCTVTETGKGFRFTASGGLRPVR